MPRLVAGKARIGTMTASDLQLRQATAADWPAVSRLFSESFHHESDPELVELERHLFEPARSLVGVDGGAVVAHTGSFGRSLRVPGGDIPAAHVALIAVAPDHRRRGLMTRLVRRQLTDLRASGEPLAVLWASEGRIYPRFGFGLAATRWDLDVDTKAVDLPPIATSAGLTRTTDPIEAAGAVRAVYDHARLARPGWSSRDDAWWRHRILADPLTRRRGATPWRATLHRTDAGTDDGYALWRVLPKWDAAGPCGQVEVRELVADSTQAYAGLWRFLLEIDLTRSLRYALAAPDEPLFHLVGEPRRLSARLADALWLRIINLPAALAGRRYATPIDVVLDVSDARLPDNGGRWRLTGDASGATCTRTSSPPDLACDAADLAAAILGEGALVPLAQAGRVQELHRGSLAPAHIAFTWPRRPSAMEMF
jgi:predicted acetyltransferase